MHSGGGSGDVWFNRKMISMDFYWEGVKGKKCDEEKEDLRVNGIKRNYARGCVIGDYSGVKVIVQKLRCLIWEGSDDFPAQVSLLMHLEFMTPILIWESEQLNSFVEKNYLKIRSQMESRFQFWTFKLKRIFHLIYFSSNWSISHLIKTLLIFLVWRMLWHDSRTIDVAYK